MSTGESVKFEMDMPVRHVDGGQGVIVGFRVVAREESWSSRRSHDALVEWDDKSRTWESTEDLEMTQ